MEFVNSQLSTMPSLQIMDVPSGTGTTKSASNVQPNGLSMLMEFVCPFLIFVLLMTPMEPVPLGTSEI